MNTEFRGERTFSLRSFNGLQTPIPGADVSFPVASGTHSASTATKPPYQINLRSTDGKMLLMSTLSNKGDWIWPLNITNMTKSATENTEIAFRWNALTQNTTFNSNFYVYTTSTGWNSAFPAFISSSTAAKGGVVFTTDQLIASGDVIGCGFSFDTTRCQAIDVSLSFSTTDPTAEHHASSLLTGVEWSQFKGSLLSIANKYMSLGTSCLLSNFSSDLDNGGYIVSSYVPNGVPLANYMQILAPNDTSYQDWSEDSIASYSQNRYGGALKNGTYMLNPAGNLSDLTLRSVYNVDLNGPFVVFAGHYANDEGSITLKIRNTFVCSAYNQIVQTVPYCQDSEIWSIALQFLFACRFTMENEKHTKYIKQVINLLDKHKHKIKDLGVSALKLTPTVIGALTALAALL
jgi:hypothetical protein